jgi:PadR family transcriptional regulator, regulatory protein PadR
VYSARCARVLGAALPRGRYKVAVPWLLPWFFRVILRPSANRSQRLGVSLTAAAVGGYISYFVEDLVPKGDLLGDFELYVLAALEQLGDDAYGVTIRQDIEERSGRATSFGAVHATLERLADKGYVEFRISAPEPVPGGRSRKYAKPTPAGRRALRASVRALDRMLAGLPLGLRPQGGRS